MTRAEPGEELVRKQTDEILAIFERRSKDGKFYYPDADVRHIIPLIALSVPIDLTGLSSLQRVMAEFFEKAGIEQGATPETFELSVRRYYGKHPVNQELLAEYKAYCRTQAQSGELDPAAIKRFAALSGKPSGGVTPGLAPPSGSGIVVKRR